MRQLLQWGDHDAAALQTERLYEERAVITKWETMELWSTFCQSYSFVPNNDLPYVPNGVTAWF